MMRILHVDRNHGRIKIVPEDAEDLFLVGRFLERGDKIRVLIERRVKREDERGSGRVVKFKGVIKVEDVEMSGSTLKIKGIIEEGPEDVVGRGRYQSAVIKPGDEILVEKSEWDDVFYNELKEAEKSSNIPEVQIVLINDEEALISSFRKKLGPIKTVRRSGEEESLREFFGEVSTYLREPLIVGGPKVVVDSFADFLREKGLKPYTVVTPLEGEKGLRDIIGKRAPQIIKDIRREKVEKAIEEFLYHLSKGDNLASLRPAEDMGNIRLLLVHEDWVRDVLPLMREISKHGGEILIVNKDMEGSEIIKKLGGVVGIRFYAP